jgi:hypothetical protein
VGIGGLNPDWFRFHPSLHFQKIEDEDNVCGAAPLTYRMRLMRSRPTLPPRLYKYQPLSPHALKNVHDGVLWFSNPHHHFNDPFDCQAVLLDAKITKEEIKEECSRSGLANPNIAQWHLEIGLGAQLQLRIWNDVSVACFSESVDDMLMWAHYADGHKGFCLEFDTSVAPLRDAQPVIYREVFPRLKVSQERLESATSEELTDSLLRRMLLTKYKGWKYEKEWRIVRSKNAHTEVFDKRAIAGVYLGAKMLWQRQEEVLSATKESRPTYKRMFRLPQKFGVSPLTFTFGSNSLSVPLGPGST